MTTPAAPERGGAAARGVLDYQAGREQARQPACWLGLRAMTWAQIGVVALLFAGVFWPNLWRLWLKVNPINGVEWSDWSHSMLVPIVGLYYLWLRREELLAGPVRPLLADDFSRARWLGGGVTLALGAAGYLIFAHGPGHVLLGRTLAEYAGPAALGAAIVGVLVLALDWGLGTMLGGMLLTAYGIWPGQNDYLKDVGMILTLFGVVLTLTGWRIMRIAWFPIAYLICAIPWPGLVYSKIAIPLQYLAAKVAVVVLNVAQVDSVVDGTRIVIEKSGGVTRVLNVAEACAGMRSLMTFITLAGALAFLSLARPLWQKLIIVASAVPIAIFCNVMRVSGQGLLDVYVTEQASEGFAHGFVGLVMLIPALFLLLGVGWALDQVFIEADDGDDDSEQTPLPPSLPPAAAFGPAKGVA